MRRGKAKLFPLFSHGRIPSFAELLYTLFFRQLANQQCIILLGHDEAVQSLHHDFALLCGVNHAVARVVGEAAVVGLGVGVFVLVGQQVERTPCAHVAPAEIAAADIDVVGLLHDAVVDRNGAAYGEYLLNSLLFTHRSVGVVYRTEEGMVFGQVLRYGRYYVLDLPDEYARVPEKLTAFEEKASGILF